MAELINVKGLAELQKFLDTLPARLEKNVMRGALRAGLNAVKPVAAANVHPVSGELAAGLKISTSARAGVVRARLRARGPHGFVARFLEYGTAAHAIVARSGKALRLLGGQLVAAVLHPGARPKPFLRPALDTQATAAVRATGEYVKARLATEQGLDTSGVEIQ